MVTYFYSFGKKNYHNHKIKFYIDSRKDYGLSIQIFKENIDYLKIKSNNEIIKKIRQIAKKNKVLLNPDFNIVEVSKIKKYNNKNMKIDGNEIKVGNILEIENKLWRVLKTQHTQPGKGGAYNQVELKEIKEGTKMNSRFRSSETVERAILDGFISILI